MHALVRAHPRYGYRRIWALLRRDGWRVNRKRVYRLWRQEGFKVVQEQRKKRRLGCSAHGIVRRRPEFTNHVWAWDFIYDRDENNRSLKWFGLIDEYTRECLALEVGRSMTAADVIDVFSQVLLIRGVPQHISSDNGPGFIAAKIRRYLAKAKFGTLYIEPGAPWENGYEESFFSRLRDEFLNAELFADLREAKTPNEVYFQLRPANQQPRIEPRTRWPLPSPCAKPRTLIAGQPGDRFEIEVGFHSWRRHLPIVSLRRAA